MIIGDAVESEIMVFGDAAADTPEWIIKFWWCCQIGKYDIWRCCTWYSGMNNYDSTCRENRTTDLVSHLSVMHQPNEVRFYVSWNSYQRTRKLDSTDGHRGTNVRKRLRDCSELDKWLLVMYNVLIIFSFKSCLLFLINMKNLKYM